MSDPAGGVVVLRPAQPDLVWSHDAGAVAAHSHNFYNELPAHDNRSALQIRRPGRLARQSSALYRVRRTFTIDVDTRVAAAQLPARWRWMRPLSAGRSRGCAAGAPGARRCDRHRCRGPRAAGDRSVPDGAAGRCVRGRAACLRHRPRRAGLHGDHRCLAGLPRAGHARLRPRPAQPTGSPRPRRRPRRAAPRSPPGRRADQAVAAGHPSGLGGSHPPVQLHERVRVPLQPAPLPQPRPAVLPGPRARRQPPTGPLPGPHRHQATIENTTNATTDPRTPPSLERPPANRPWRTT